MGAKAYHDQAAALFAVDHFKETGRIMLHDEVKAILLKRKKERAVTKARKQEHRPARHASQQEEFRL
jgi:hypothetical protein